MVKFKVKKLTDYNLLNGTSLKGNIDCDYDTLVKVFGEPAGLYDNCKSDCAWDLVINGIVVSIYNYKDGKNYLGAKGLDVKDITDWHIGSNSNRAQEFVEIAINQHYE